MVCVCVSGGGGGNSEKCLKWGGKGEGFIKESLQKQLKKGW